MGYIFDALNKQNGDTPEDPTQGQEANEQHTDAQPPRTGLSDLMASLQESSGSDDTPLPASTEQAAPDADLDASFTPEDIDLSFSAQDTTSDDVSIADPALTADFSIDEPLQQIGTSAAKPSWWSKLLGRHFQQGNVDDRLVAMTSPASAMSEEYRSIRTSILARHDNERHLVHTITSATPQEGKTITCVNLGLTFAELRNRKTLVIECDLRLPTFGKLLNCDNERPGLINYLRGEAKLGEIIQQVEGSALHIIPAGGRVSDEAVQLLSSQRMSNLIQGLRAKYDHVIIDTPPVLQLADAGILGSQSEEVLVIARMRRTPRPLVEQAITTLTSYNAQVGGIVATDNPRSRGRAYGYRYGYRYGYGYGYGYGYTPDSRGRKRRKRRAA